MDKQICLKFVRSPLMRTQQRLLDILRDRYDVQIVDSNPDYVIGSAFDCLEQLKYKNAVKILFTGENIVPDFNLYDYAIGFDYINFGDRYLRLPLYCFYPNFEELDNRNAHVDYEMLAHRKFCSFVVSNGQGADPIRTKFFQELGKYKKVDSAGRYMNNMGGAYLENKRQFIADYKFNIAFENSCVDGYTTEKIMEPMSVNSVPIYWGNKRVGEDFNPRSFINLSNFTTIQECVDYIIALDKDDDKYIAMLQEAKLNKNSGLQNYKELLWDFFGNIFSKPKEEAAYLSEYGFQPYYRNNLTRYQWMAPYARPLRYIERGKKALLHLFKCSK